AIVQTNAEDMVVQLHAHRHGAEGIDAAESADIYVEILKLARPVLAETDLHAAAAGPAVAVLRPADRIGAAAIRDRAFGVEGDEGPAGGRIEQDVVDGRVADARAHSRKPGDLVGAVHGRHAVGRGEVVTHVGALQVGFDPEHDLTVGLLPVVADLT